MGERYDVYVVSSHQRQIADFFYVLFPSTKARPLESLATIVGLSFLYRHYALQYRDTYILSSFFWDSETKTRKRKKLVRHVK